MNHEHLNLIQAEIDGANTAADSEHVERLLATDPDLKSAYEELQTVRLAIESFSELEPPASLKASVMNAIAERAPVAAPARPASSRWSALLDLVRLPRPVSLAYAFSLGLIVAFVVTSVIAPPSGTGGLEPVGGTMVAPSLSDHVVLAEYPFDDPSLEGGIRVAGDDSEVLVEFNWDNPGPVEVHFQVDGEILSVSGSRYLTRPTAFQTTATDREIIVTGSGPIRQMVAIDRFDGDSSTGSLRIQVLSNGSPALDRTVAID